MRFYKIPVFLANEACPNKCVFCNQYAVASLDKIPLPNELPALFDKHFQTFKNVDSNIEVAFFGGNFTGISLELQKKYLEVAAKYLDMGKIHGIRISTRPDFIDSDKLMFLKSMGVSAIELGTQSMDENVLNVCRRNHTAQDSINAAKLIKDFGFELGMQMMTGLPKDTEEQSINTAKEIIRLGAETTRIYPCLVVKGTELENMYKRGEYKPQTLDEAIRLTAKLVDLFEDAKVNVLRVGLHPSEGFIRGEELVDGPFHPAFGELVRSVMWYNNFKNASLPDSQSICITVNPKSINAAIGHSGCNKIWLKKKFAHVVFKTDNSLGVKEFHVNPC
ncbi:MAG: radical SAM protein [Bacteroidetes bacterium]|nr:radical SAM protein [Bacteroidota bacterium]